MRDHRLPTRIATLTLLTGCVVSEGVDASECRNAATAQARAEAADGTTRRCTSRCYRAGEGRGRVVGVA